MKEVHYSSKAKKDLKRYRNNEPLMRALYDVLHYLINGEKVPVDYYPHPLHGDYKGCMECHVEDDFLLIWIDANRIEVIRVGSHSELYGKGRSR